jgi:hypothetical protein
VVSTHVITPFASVNSRGSANYLDGWHKHHVFTSQCRNDRELNLLFVAMEARGVSLNDFRFNGMLLPAVEKESRRANLPLHVVGHKLYNKGLLEHLHQIRRFCETIRTDAVQNFAAAALGLFTLAHLRGAIQSVGHGSIDETPILRLTDADIDRVIARCESGCDPLWTKKCGREAAFS